MSSYLDYYNKSLIPPTGLAIKLQVGSDANSYLEVLHVELGTIVPI